jgi:two-component sensor histidine kinase
MPAARFQLEVRDPARETQRQWRALRNTSRIRQRLAYNADYENIDVVAYLRRVVGDLEPAPAPRKIQFAPSHS